MNVRWKRWLALAAGLLALYTAAGFWLVPWAIQQQLPRWAQAELARQASVGDVKFNPFTLRLHAADLRLAEADGAPLVSVGTLAVELQWRSLVRRAWSFAHVRITSPRAQLAIAQDGRFNLAELIAAFDRRPREDSGTGLPRVVIGQFALEQGQVDFQDRRAGYGNTFAPIDFALTNFSTLPEQNEDHLLTAESARGGKLRWKGSASVNPIRGSGELVVENASLPEVAVYLKSYSRANVAAGQLWAHLPYTFSYRNGKFEAALAGARVALQDLALARDGATDSFAALTRLEVNDIAANLPRRELSVGEIRADGGKLHAKRAANGELDLANLMIATAGAAAASDSAEGIAPEDWKLAIGRVLLQDLAFSAIDETAVPPVRVEADKLRLQLQLNASQAGGQLRMAASAAEFSAADLALASGGEALFKLGQLGFSEGTFDLQARQVAIGRVYAQGGQLQLARDRQGKLNVMSLLPRFDASGDRAPPPRSEPPSPWRADVKIVDLAGFRADVHDQGSGVKVHVDDFALKLDGASSDLSRAVKFTALASLREGGRLETQGRLVPANAALQADMRVKQLALAPLQPLLGQYVKLKIAGGHVSTHGRLVTGPKSGGLRYAGGFDIAGLALKEEDGDLFAAWKNMSAENLVASLNPNRLEIPDLQVVDANAKLIIEDDRSLNAARLLVQPPEASKATPGAAAGAETADPFPIRIRRISLRNAKLDFTDLSLRPQFSAKIHELNGVVNGLSSNRQSRSQLELDGRVDEFGLARIRGELNPFAPRNNTDVGVVFRNVDMVSASPYSMKFAGYRIAEGKISLDLQYKVRDSRLEGANQIVIDRLTLGERVDSPDALKLPLELAIAILKDSDGRIELGLPVTGNIDDPQFSYGALIWKAVGMVLTKIVTAPFRAIGALLGISGEKLEAIDFDPGSARVLPPEREKLKQLAQLLAKRPQLKLSVPAHYSEAADGAAMRARAVRSEIARRAGVKLAPDEEPGPIDVGNRATRAAVRELYAARFGDAELDKQKKAAEAANTAPAGAATQRKELAIWQRVGNLIQGEPQVADASGFYDALIARLNRDQALPDGALAALGRQRAAAILGALGEAGIEPARAVAGPPENIEAHPGKPVPAKLALAAR